MDSQPVTQAELVRLWRAYCQQQPARFADLGDQATGMRRLAQLEAKWLADVCDGDLTIAEQAAAFRSIMELRLCTARDLDQFLHAASLVVATALSLIPLAPRRPTRGKRSRPISSALPAPHKTDWLPTAESSGTV